MKKSFKEIAITSFLSVVVFMTLLFFLAYITGVEYISKEEMLGFYIGSILVIYIPIFIGIVLFNFSFKMGKRVADIEKSDIDFNKDKTYYREIIDEYGILELAYINNMQTLEKKDIAAALLNLELKKVIKLKDNQITYIDNKEMTNSENYILSNCVSGKVNMDNINILCDIVKQEAIKSGLIEKETNVAKDIILMFIKTNVFATIAFSLLFFSASLYMEYSNFLTMTLCVILFLLNGLSGYRMVYFFSYAYHKIKSYKLTDKGKEIKSKLDGLKLYIKEFSDLDDENKNSLMLWEDYLIYSVMFGVNKNIVNDMKCINNKTFKFSIKYVIIFVVILFFLFFL